MRHIGGASANMNVIAKLAIVFAGVIVAAVFLNLYLFVAMPVFVPVVRATGFDSDQVFKPLYWICFAAGAVTSFFVMRPAWRSLGKIRPKSAGTKPPEAD